MHLELVRERLLTEALYRSSSSWLAGVLRRIGSGEATDDIVHETFLRLSEIASAGEAEHPRALLLRIATNILRDQWRKKGRRERPDYRASLADYEPASVGADQLERVLLHDIVRSLPPLQREVFVLSRFGGRTNAEIATICGISLKAVESRMSKALALCAERLRD
jgi:RNA polymerase sigma-70 factor (ECF subfamily)